MWFSEIFFLYCAHKEWSWNLQQFIFVANEMFPINWRLSLLTYNIDDRIHGKGVAPSQHYKQLYKHRQSDT